MFRQNNDSRQSQPIDGAKELFDIFDKHVYADNVTYNRKTEITKIKRRKIETKI